MKKFKHSKTFLIIIGFIIYCNSITGQIMLELKPGFKFIQTSFFKTNLDIQKADGYDFEASNKRQISKFCFEPELFLDFYKLNKKWSFGLGLTSYNFTLQSNLKGSRSNSKDTIVEGSTQLLAKNTQFIFTATRKVEFKKPILNAHGSNLIFGLGVNKLLNSKTEYFDFGKVIGYNIMLTNHLYGTLYNYSPVLMLKYEVLFSKFNVHLSYIKGFKNYNNIITTAKSSDVNVSSITTSLGSGLRFGISKIFTFEKKHMNPILN